MLMQTGLLDCSFAMVQMVGENVVDLQQQIHIHEQRETKHSFPERRERVGHPRAENGAAKRLSGSNVLYRMHQTTASGSSHTAAVSVGRVFEHGESFEVPEVHYRSFVHDPLECSRSLRDQKE